MTAIAIWYEPVDSLVWSVSDTRISVPTSNGVAIRTDAAAKLFALPVKCGVTDYTNPDLRRIGWSTTFGFAFCGDALPALMTFASASTLLSDLVSDNEAPPPSLANVANVMQKLGTRFGREIVQSKNGGSIPFEAAVYGWCPVKKAFAIYKLSPTGSNIDHSLVVEETLPASAEDVVLLGSGTSALRAELRRLSNQANCTGNAGRRLPKLALQNLVRRNELHDVGGSISIGIAARSGFSLMQEVKPIREGESNAAITYNGIDVVNEIDPIGSYRVAIAAVV